MSKLQNALWFDLIARTQMEQMRANSEYKGLVGPDGKIRTRKSEGGAVILTLMFGSLGLVYVSIKHAFLMFFANTGLYILAIVAWYYLGFEYAFFIFVSAKFLTGAQAVRQVEKYNKEVDIHERERKKRMKERVRKSVQAKMRRERASHYRY